jgi:hypothetical protein
MGLATLSPEFFRHAFRGVPQDFTETLSWVCSWVFPCYSPTMRSAPHTVSNAPTKGAMTSG